MITPPLPPDALARYPGAGEATGLAVLATAGPDKPLAPAGPGPLAPPGIVADEWNAMGVTDGR
ncbi:hypothetical protein [Micromonospora sp. NPDC023644]|uniref:hypothetical protein n=1 Tax=Micromonospora sp. NPDC023644 TaxID=3154321 RepID=UPI003400D321